MKEFNLRFFIERRWPDKLSDLLKIDENDLPTTSGTYVLGSHDGTNFIYPWGSSPIFYVGQSSNLKKRLLTHKKHIVEV